MIRSVPIYHMQTKGEEMFYGLIVLELVDLDMPAAPILWEHEGVFGLIPMEHVEEILEVERRIQTEKKTAWPLTRIPWSAAIPLDYNLGRALSRRVTQ